MLLKRSWCSFFSFLFYSRSWSLVFLNQWLVCLDPTRIKVENPTQVNARIDNGATCLQKRTLTFKSHVSPTTHWWCKKSISNEHWSKTLVQIPRYLAHVLDKNWYNNIFILAQKFLTVPKSTFLYMTINLRVSHNWKIVTSNPIVTHGINTENSTVELGESGRSITLVKKLSHNYKFDPLIALHQCFVRERKWKKKKKKNFPITCSKYGRINWKNK